MLSLDLDEDLRAQLDVRSKVADARMAFESFEGTGQARIDRIVDAMARAGTAAAQELARLAVDETGHGVYEHKILKNRFNTEYVASEIRDMRTVGVLWADDGSRTAAIGAPVGVIAALIPVTNPTSTVLFKSLVAVKAGNAVVFAPHPRAARCCMRTAEILAQAAERAGAPEGLISCLQAPSLDATTQLMSHRDVALVLATGGQDMVRAAYSCGKPTIAVGPGNVPVYVDRSVADLRGTAEGIIASKTFDNGTGCVSEQAIVVHEAVADRFFDHLKRAGLAWVPPEHHGALASVLFTEAGGIRPSGVGQPAADLARQAGLEVDEATRALGVLLDQLGPRQPLSREKLAPVLAVYRVPSVSKGWELCQQVLAFGGEGHSICVYTEDTDVVARFSAARAGRILVNSPAYFGGAGYSADVGASFMLGTGTWGGSITSDNVTPLHLMNIKRVAYPSRSWRTLFEL